MPIKEAKKQKNKSHCPICGSNDLKQVFVYTEPPAGEIRYNFSVKSKYHREIWQCRNCAHFISTQETNDRSLYEEDYVNSTYKDAQGLRRTFERITGLDPAKSDNIGRVKRVLEFSGRYWGSQNIEKPSILDVGSGLCVFLHRMKAAGWDCTAIDPDQRAVRHAQETVGVKAMQGDFLKIKDIGKFDTVTFNKVLEHVKNPLKMLCKARKNLTPKGFVYIEVPDGEIAVQGGKGREEFFVEHLHVFSLTSLSLMIQKAGYCAVTIERLKEPSTKYTLRAFIVPKTNEQTHGA